VEGAVLSGQDAESKMLEYYAQRLTTVEINYTFYRMPNAKTVALDAVTPAGFSFVLKAPQRITHVAGCATWTTRCVTSRDRRKLGPKLGRSCFNFHPISRRTWTV